MTIKQHFEGLLADVQPAGGFSQLQRQEMERAFYAGFFAMQMEQLNTSNMTDDDGVKHLAALFDEAEVYFKTLGKCSRDTTRN
jgi:hypothetical protein